MKTEKLRREVEAAGGAWRDVARMTEADLAQLVRKDKVGNFTSYSVTGLGFFSTPGQFP